MSLASFTHTPVFQVNSLVIGCLQEVTSILVADGVASEKILRNY